MKATSPNRRDALRKLGQLMGGLWLYWVARPVRLLAKGALDSAAETKAKAAGPPDTNGFALGYDPRAHRWSMAIDVEKCIGCGLCGQACKQENHVPPQPFYFRTWIERYVIRKAPLGSGQARGETVVDSPNGGLDGFGASSVPVAEMLKTFFVPKLCNLCEASPCIQSCPVGATFDTPDGAVLVDSRYCIGCGFCIQACPYGCRFLNPLTHTADKCSLCYHRITRGLQPACVAVCPTQARVFGDLKDSAEANPLRRFVHENKVQVLKPHLGTHPRVFYAGLDKEVR